MISENRNDIRVVEAIAASPNISSVNVWSPGRIDNLEIFVPSFVSAVLGFFAGLTYGQWKYDVTEASFAIGFILAWLSYNAFHFADKLTGITRYGARWWDFEEEQEERPDGFIQSARSNERKRLTGRMRVFLQKFAQHYAELNTMAIIAWYESKYLNRSQIEDVRDYTVLIGAAERDSRGVVSLTGWGVEQLPKWAAGDFGDVIELSRTPPPQDSRHTRDIEVGAS